VTIISSPAGAVEEGIENMSDDGYVEMRNGRKILFQRWSPIISNDEKTNKKLKKSIEKFISATIQNVTTCCSHVETVVFRTNEWENVGTQQTQFVEYLINMVKQDWRILFLFNDKQINFYKEFYQVFIRLQTDQDGFAQFSCPISSKFNLFLMILIFIFILQPFKSLY
jgi:hypothetical protein